jgi:hypothetical protein
LTVSETLDGLVTAPRISIAVVGVRPHITTISVLVVRLRPRANQLTHPQVQPRRPLQQQVQHSHQQWFLLEHLQQILPLIRAILVHTTATKQSEESATKMNMSVAHGLAIANQTSGAVEVAQHSSAAPRSSQSTWRFHPLFKFLS